MIPTNARKVLALLERDEEVVKNMAVGRAQRLGRLIDLDAPEFIITIELRMLMEAIEAIFRKHGYDPTTDDRVNI